MVLKSIRFLLLLLSAASICNGQNSFHKWIRLKPDTAYVQNNQHDLILRVYASQKYSNQTITDRGDKTSLSYRPSNGYVVGLGFNYKFLGVNIGTIFPFAQHDINKYGRTRYLDFQSHLYLRFLTVDFYTGYYKGLYLANSASVLKPPSRINEFYTRGDIETYSGGFGIYANLNPTKYTIRAPFLQNEWQKKSAGQPMLGLELYWVSSRADSSFIPSELANQRFFDRVDFTNWRFYSLNITGGYAYTLVICKRFFVMAGINGSLGLGEYQLSPVAGAKMNRIYPNFSLNQKFGLGYHFDKIYVGMSLANFQYFTPTPIKQTSIMWQTGNLRFNIAYRVGVKKDIEIRPWKWFGSK
jgi:hypothetical protein